MTIGKSIYTYGFALKLCEVAEYLKISTKLASRLIRTGALPAVKVGREYRVARESLLKYIKGETKNKCVETVTSNPRGWTSGKNCGNVCDNQTQKEA